MHIFCYLLLQNNSNNPMGEVALGNQAVYTLQFQVANICLVRLSLFHH